MVTRTIHSDGRKPPAASTFETFETIILEKVRKLPFVEIAELLNTSFYTVEAILRNLRVSGLAEAVKDMNLSDEQRQRNQPLQGVLGFVQSHIRRTATTVLFGWRAADMARLLSLRFEGRSFPEIEAAIDNPGGHVVGMATCEQMFHILTQKYLT